MGVIKKPLMNNYILRVLVCFFSLYLEKDNDHIVVMLVLVFS